MKLQEAVSQFLFHCRYEKNLSPKTLKAYSIDLRQFMEHLAEHLEITDLPAVDKTALRAYTKTLFGPLKEKSVKRKVATLKALFHSWSGRTPLPSIPSASFPEGLPEPLGARDPGQRLLLPQPSERPPLRAIRPHHAPPLCQRSRTRREGHPTHAEALRGHPAARRKEGVDIRFIQTMLGHTSINTIQIYTEVRDGHQRRVLATRHPRRKMRA